MKKKIKRPRDLELCHEFKLKAGEKGQKIMYLLENDRSHLWIPTLRKMKAIQNWINNAVKYAEAKNKTLK